MVYATRADIEELWGLEFIQSLMPQDLAEEPALGAAVAGALDRASEEIDAHLSARYSVPLATQPLVLVTPCANIAIYVLANRHTALTQTIEDRYGHAIKLLQRIADGKAGLGAQEPKVSTDPDSSAGGASFTASERQFGRHLP
tara:strand:- start:29318 stop:29746 length:429 start_codon:yes stop_codon:yes gene_type:complete